MTSIANNGIPAAYDYINVYNSVRKPSTVHAKNSSLTWYFKRYLLQKIISVYKFSGIPKTWAFDYFIYTLFVFGYVAVIQTDKFGVIPQHCSLMGYDVFYRPTNAVIANPLLKGIRQPRIGSECEVIKMQPDYCGCWDIVEVYADLLALACEDLGGNLVNTKFAYIFGAENKAAAQSLKKMFDEIQEGNPAVFVDKNLYNDNGELSIQLLTQNLQQSYIAGDILNDMAKIDSRFNTEIGIPNVNIAKASGVSNSEVQSNNVDTRSKCELWLDTMRDGIEKVNSMFGTSIDVDLRFKTGEVLNDGNAFDISAV